MLKTEREIIYAPTETAESNAVANVFLILLVLALVGFLGYYIAVMVPAASVTPSSSTLIQRTTEKQIVVPVPTNTVTPMSAPATSNTAPAPATGNTAPADNGWPASENNQ